MKESKHTKGEWEVVDNYHLYEEYSQDNPTMYIWNGDEEAHKPICDMGEMGDMNYATELANARLIASAPKLLLYLSELLDIVGSGDGYCQEVNQAKELIELITEGQNINS